MKHIIVALGLVLMSSSVLGSNKWDTLIESDKITDEKYGIAVVKDESNSQSRSILLGAGCYEGSDELLVFFQTSSYLGDDPIDAIIRFDKTDPIELRMETSADGTDASVRGSEADGLIDMMRAGTTMYARLYDYRDVGRDGQFTLLGFTKAINKACGWSLAFKNYMETEQLTKDESQRFQKWNQLAAADAASRAPKGIGCEVDILVNNGGYILTVTPTPECGSAHIVKRAIMDLTKLSPAPEDYGVLPEAITVNLQ